MYITAVSVGVLDLKIETWTIKSPGLPVANSLVSSWGAACVGDISSTVTDASILARRAITRIAYRRLVYSADCVN
jgi:hypothetical protein